jgi:hypothetical protein
MHLRDLFLNHGDLFLHAWTALVLAGLGIAQLLFPNSCAFFTRASGFFRRAYANLTPEQSERLRRVLEARCDAEGVPLYPTRYTGLLGIAMAAAEFVPGMPFVIPYAVYCLGGALVVLAAYVRVRRASEKRAAPLVPRSPFDVLSPLLIGALAGCFAGVVLLAAYPPYRAGAIGVAVSMILLGWIAWRVAGSRALMFGDDPQLEYTVDERLRLSRATTLVALACAPGVVLAGTAVISTPPDYQFLGALAIALTYGSFAVAGIVNFTTLRRLPAKLLNGTSV